MPPDAIVRPERPGDIAPIAEVTAAAFLNHPYSHNTEPFIIAALRRARALTISLVAELDGEVVGHIAFSPVRITDGAANWFGLGPVAVAPRLQRRGIGQRLVREGLEALRRLGAGGCVLVGDPAFYNRFGFAGDASLVLPGVPPRNFMALWLSGPRPKGEVAFHDAFHATA